MAALKLRKLGAGRYQIGETSLTIEKGEAPRFRMPQEWDVMDGETYLFSAKGKDMAAQTIERILRAFA